MTKPFPGRMTPGIVLSFTGHRPEKLGGHNARTNENLKNLARDYLRPQRESLGYVISGMALGWDQAVCEAALALDIPVLAAIPFLGQERVWPTESQTHYRRLLHACRWRHIVSTGGYSPAKMHVRNHWMVDNCDDLVALYNGSNGGTYECVTYARSVGRRVINLWPEWIMPTTGNLF